MKAKCEICNELIGSVEPDKLTLPLKGEMFGSPDLEHGYPRPFFAEATYEFMRCPFGPHRPILLPDRILTDEGYVKITAEGAKVIEDGLTSAQREIRDRKECDRASELMARANLGIAPRSNHEIVVDALSKQVYPSSPKGDGEGTASPKGCDTASHAPLPETVFSCPKCGKSFKAEKFLKMHITVKHKESVNG